MFVALSLRFQKSLPMCENHMDDRLTILETRLNRNILFLSPTKLRVKPMISRKLIVHTFVKVFLRLLVQSEKHSFWEEEKDRGVCWLLEGGDEGAKCADTQTSNSKNPTFP